MNEIDLINTVLGREVSLFKKDLTDNYTEMGRRTKGKNVLVIGGAGTIGFHFIKALIPLEPARIIIIDTNENGLAEVIRDLRSTAEYSLPELLTYPISFSNKIFKKIFLHHGPFQIVANFAAHKHVRSEKDIFSIEALLENNLLQAFDLMELLRIYPPEHFFCVSTDKAANPVNIMGASKKMMEHLIMSYSNSFKVTTARFANVAFSNGSLLESFRRRMDKKQPLSCPEDVRRFFVSPEEAGQICLMACLLGNSSEIFFPKLHPENDLINIADILQKFLSALSYTQYVCESEEDARSKRSVLSTGQYPVYYSKADSSGEKLYEEFYTDEEKVNLSRFDMLGVISTETSQYQQSDFSAVVSEFREVLDEPGLLKDDIVRLLNKHIPEFNHIETGISLDSKM